MRHLGACVVLAILLVGDGRAMAQELLDLTGTWIPTQGAHVIEGPTLHHHSGTELITDEAELKRHTSAFVFHFEEQDGRTFWGHLTSREAVETLIGVFSVDGTRFVIA